MAKLTLTKDPSHSGYYLDEDGNLYVFRFGGRPIKVDEYREDKPHDTRSEEKMEVDSSKVIDHRKSATKEENDKFLEAAEADYEKRQSDIKKFEKQHDDQMVNHLESRQKDLVHEINNTEERNKKTAKDIIKEKTGEKEMYQSIAKLMNDNEDKLSSEEWKALDNARMILKENPELIADESPLLDESKPIHERLSKYMNDNEAKLDSGVWGPLYEANQELRKHDAAEITKLKDRYQKTQGVSDDWFTEEGRNLGMKDEDIADAIYIKKGAEAQGSTDDNIKRIIANTEKQHYERLIKEYKEAIKDPKTGEWDREFMKSELPGLENKAEMFANYEAEFIKRVNRDDEVFNVKYRDSEFVENFKARGLDEAYALKDEWLKYSDDVHIYDSNGNEIIEDSKNQKHYTSPTYEKNKLNEKKASYRERLYGADRSTLISMVHNLGLNWNVERFTDQQLYRMLEKELNKKGK